MTESVSEPLWQRCERAWAGWLDAHGYAPTILSGATGNTPGTNAPMSRAAGHYVRTPDILATKAGRSQYWEVKQRSRPDIDPLTAVQQHWISLSSFNDYRSFARTSGSPVSLALYESGTATQPGRWLKITIRGLLDAGHRDIRRDQSGLPIEAWVWPVAAMTIVPDGPAVDEQDAQTHILPMEQEAVPPIPLKDLLPLERELRRSPRRRAPIEASTAEALLQDNPAAGLDVLCARLRLSKAPEYSLTAMLPADGDFESVLALLAYGIRVFLIADHEPEDLTRPTIAAFRDARLLEASIVPSRVSETRFYVDGQLDGTDSGLRELLHESERCGGINWQQYRIVHAPDDQNILVTAGAGTGKTETMSERLVFLLATHRPGIREDQNTVSSDLRVDDVVLVTFTREAARELRLRLARTLMLRQRLAERCVLPALAWLMQLGGADISTLHSYARVILRQAGSAIGIAPGFSVSPQTMEFRALLRQELSPHLDALFAEFPSDAVPPEFAWEKHLENLWHTLQNNGVQLLELGESGTYAPLENQPVGVAGTDLSSRVPAVVAEVIERVRISFGRLCADRHVLPVGQLVPLAVSALRQSAPQSVRPPRYLFIDEFQDTDSLQMDLMLEVGSRLDARLFVVGDVKQGIYRFRGAQGNAFDELRSRVEERRNLRLSEYSLARNFRSGRELLASLEPYFDYWGNRDFLRYSVGDRLEPDPVGNQESKPLQVRDIRRGTDDEVAAQIVQAWRTSDPNASIALLCRENWQALRCRDAVRSLGLSCEIVVGGDFFRTPAVIEMRAFLEAVRDPQDAAAVLELCETRWASGLLSGEAPLGVDSTDASYWATNAPVPSNWDLRVAEVELSGSFLKEDLEPLQQRLNALGALLKRMSTMAWLVECIRAIAPSQTSRPGDDETERARYQRCLDHLVTLLDQQFTDSPAPLDRILEWLRLQIATNDSEDEPVDTDHLERRTLASTVHKAKGLEYDKVVVPYTWSRFGASDRVVTEAVVLRPEGRSPLLMWEWKWDGQSHRYTNVSPAQQVLWSTNSRETLEEETRLLYVAMTRARSELVLLRTPRPGAAPGIPETWADLLRVPGGV